MSNMHLNGLSVPLLQQIQELNLGLVRFLFNSSIKLMSLLTSSHSHCFKYILYYVYYLNNRFWWHFTQTFTLISAISDWLNFNFNLCSFSTQQATCALMKTILRYEDKSRIELKYCWETQWLNAKEIIMHETKIIFQPILFVLLCIHTLLPITQQ